MTHLEKQLEVALEVVRALAKRGHIVLGVKAAYSSAKPTIEVAHTHHCDELRGVPTVEFKNTGNVRESVVALVGDCRVQWRPN